MMMLETAPHADPAELLLAAAAGHAVALPPELARQLLAAASDADVATRLGLSLPRRIRMRNEAMLEAARILGADGCTTWQAAHRLAHAVLRFERAILPALRAGHAVNLAPHEAALWRAYQLRGARMLRSPRKLYSLLMLES